MAIKLFTGTPGAGKTLRSIFEAINLQKLEGRQIFHIGIDGMDEQIIPKAPIESIADWRKLPPGSVLIVDEAHKFLPVRQPGKPADWIQELTEIRHYGIELWLVTQDPRNIDSFVRRLIGSHTHLSRKAGLNGATITEFQGVSEDPTDYHNRQTATQSTWLYPKHLFKVYKSATLHVIKPKIPFKVLFMAFVLFACIVGIPTLLYFFQDKVAALDDKEEVQVSEDKKSAASFITPSPQNSDKIKWETADDFIKAHKPLVVGIPHSAPIYQNLEPVGVPELLCVASGLEGAPDRTCNCYTEQATKIVGIPSQICEANVKQGFYNPYRPKPTPASTLLPPPLGEGEGVGPGGATSDVFGS